MSNSAVRPTEENIFMTGRGCEKFFVVYSFIYFLAQSQKTGWLVPFFGFDLSTRCQLHRVLRTFLSRHNPRYTSGVHRRYSLSISRRSQDLRLCRGDMEAIWNLLLQSLVSPATPSSDGSIPPPLKRSKFDASSSREAPQQAVLPTLRKINDSVFEVYAPQERRPSVEIIFFHGLQVEGSDKAHVTTWLSRDQSELWLHWILRKIPNARILTISYDAHVRRTSAEGLMDMYKIRENLVIDLVDAEVGQDGCPVVLVGHCVGGLVMKEVCVQANSKLNLDVSPNIPVQNLLHHLKGLFFFATPHHGTRLADKSTRSSKGLLFEDVATNKNQAARRNEDFRKLRQKYGWRSFGVVESRQSHLVIPDVVTFTGFIVAEASARHDVDTFYTDTTADHFQVCRPHSTQSSSFQKLSQFVTQVVKEDNKTRQGHEIRFPDEVIGLQDQVNLVLNELKQAPRLGIVGMGGIGKTTLAKTVYNAISQRFEYSCFLPEVKKLFADEENPDNLRATIVKELYWKGRRVPENFEWSTLRGKSVLIVLDDAKTGSQVRVMTNLDGFLEESRVIVTARDRGVLISESFRCHFAVRLNDDDSRKLFCWHAFRTTSAPEGFQDHLQSMLKKCAGLPLALKVAGRYLYNRPKRLWDAALERLSRAQPLTGTPEDGLWSILTVSYDSLAVAEREMFLDVATFFHGQSLNDAKTMWKMCGWEAVECSWENLLDKCLVTQVPQHRVSRFPYKLKEYLRKMDKLGELEPDDEGVRDCIIQMHEVLRDFGQSRACPHNGHVVDHTRASCDVFNPEAFRPPNQGQPKLEVLNISNPPRYDPIMNISTFHGLNDLRILSLDGGVLEGALYVLPRRLMCLQVSNLADWIDSGFLRRLEILDCFALRSFSSSLEQLHHLKYLVISECRLQVLPSLRRLQALEHLTIDGCRLLKDLPKCLGELRALKYLSINKCRSLKRLPDSFGELRTLEHLEVTGCTNLVLPNTLGQLENLKHLEIKDCLALGTLGNVVGKLTALRHLEVESRDNSDVLLSNLGRLESLKYLTITESGLETHHWDTFRDGFGELRCLKQLRKRRKHLKQLRKQQKQQEKQFRLNWPGGFKALPNTLGDFPTLEVLVLDSQRLEILPETLGELLALKTLVIRSDRLRTLPDSLGQLRALQYLHIEAPSIKALPDTVGGLEALKYLYIFASLTALPDAIAELHALKRLELRMCQKLETIPDSLRQLEFLGQLEFLEQLKIEYCPNLKDLPDSLKRRGFNLAPQENYWS